jgi:hypothetical protein
MRAGRAGWLVLGAAVLALAIGPDVPRPTGSPVTGSGSVAARADGGLPSGLGAGSAAAGAAGGLTVLQLNLCDSGEASCYSGGRSVPEAARVITAARPDAVTLDEICRHDLTTLSAALRQAFPGDTVTGQFQAVHERDDSISTCVNGDQYGIGILVHLPSSGGTSVRGDEYPGQGGNRGGERRVWECLYVTGSHYVCATHLSAFDHQRALGQCRYLMDTAIPDTLTRLGGYHPTVVGGDLNLPDSGTGTGTGTGIPSVADCLPAGWRNAGDGGVQHVLATADHEITATHRLPMTYTDHPALLVTLRPVAARSR